MPTQSGGVLKNLYQRPIFGKKKKSLQLFVARTLHQHRVSDSYLFVLHRWDGDERRRMDGRVKKKKEEWRAKVFPRVKQDLT